MNSMKITRDMKLKILMILAMVSTVLLGFLVYQGNDVIVNLDGQVMTYVTYANTVKEFVESEELNVKEGAYLSIPLKAEIKEDIELTIKNQKNYTLDIEGDLTEIESVHTKVADIMKDAGIKLSKADFTLPAKSEEVDPDTTIKLYKVTEAVEIVDSDIPFEEEVTMNKDVDRGVINVVQEGKNGLRKQEIKNEYINGVLNSSVVIQDEIIEEPVAKIIEKGTKDLIVATSRGDTRYKKSITMHASAYSAEHASTGKGPGDKYYGVTASGTKARPGVVAVDPKVIPLGTELYIQSLDGTNDYGFAVAEDTGGSIKGNKIDLFYNTESQCYSFGRRNVKVYILE
ncbi:MAG: 3D domain-containing protein [Tissierellia bacterium]|nr:3D domain-containing protein [Tissierellia bacterium]MDD4725374.1 3D domain-containing protein [Tissierellia bacterium]